MKRAPREDWWSVDSITPKMVSTSVRRTMRFRVFLNPAIPVQPDCILQTERKDTKTRIMPLQTVKMTYPVNKKWGREAATVFQHHSEVQAQPEHTLKRQLKWRVLPRNETVSARKYNRQQRSHNRLPPMPHHREDRNRSRCPKGCYDPGLLPLQPFSKSEYGQNQADNNDDTANDIKRWK